MKRSFFLMFFSFLLAGFLLYGRSLRYEFVYDDHWRIVQNASIKSLSRVGRFFADSRTQASLPDLHYDNYRPIMTLIFATDHALWGLSPTGYRVKNLLIHVLNASLVGLVGLVLLGLSFPAALFSGFLFLIHPVQVESVAWIVEQSNLLGTMCILVGLLSWHVYLKGNRAWALATNFFCLAIGLLIRETVVCLPVACLLLELLRNGKPNTSMMWKSYLGMMFVVGIFLAARSAALGQFKIAPFWGGTIGTNFANVLATWPLYLKAAAWPLSFRVTYGDLSFVSTFRDAGVIWGGGLFLGFVGMVFFLFKTNKKGFFCAAGFLLFWLPGSNLVPIMILFAERLMYPMMIFFCLLLALLFQRKRVRMVIRPALGSFLVLCCVLAWRQIGFWKNEYALWMRATTVAPASWFAWVCRGQEELKIFERSGHDKVWLEKARVSYREAFNHQLPLSAAGDAFLKLAQIYWLQGNLKVSREIAERAFVLRPDLRPAWEAFRNSVRSADGT